MAVIMAEIPTWTVCTRKLFKAELVFATHRREDVTRNNRFLILLHELFEMCLCLDI
jgi:hypothetical protein